PPRQQPREQITIPRPASTRDPRVRKRGCHLPVARQQPALELILPTHRLIPQLLIRRIRVDEELRREEAAHGAPTLETSPTTVPVQTFRGNGRTCQCANQALLVAEPLAVLTLPKDFLRGPNVSVAGA